MFDVLCLAFGCSLFRMPPRRDAHLQEQLGGMFQVMQNIATILARQEARFDAFETNGAQQQPPQPQPQPQEHREDVPPVQVQPQAPVVNQDEDGKKMELWGSSRGKTHLATRVSKTRLSLFNG